MNPFGCSTSFRIIHIVISNDKTLKGRIINELLALFAFHHFTLYKAFYINFNYFLLIKEKKWCRGRGTRNNFAGDTYVMETRILVCRWI